MVWGFEGCFGGFWGVWGVVSFYPLGTRVPRTARYQDSLEAELLAFWSIYQNLRSLGPRVRVREGSKDTVFARFQPAGTGLVGVKET